MRILLTNHRLDDRGGSVTYLRDVAAALRRRGHHPVAYAPFLGLAAEDVRRTGVPVVRDLSLIAEPPDLIHGQHHLPTVEAMLHFPSVPAVFFCHGWLPWQDLPPRLSRIMRYVCVSALTRDRLVTEMGIPSALVEVIPNFVDLKRFLPRRDALPEAPRRALIFSNNAVPGKGFHAAVEAACAERGIEVDTLGLHSGRVPLPPEELLADYDIVFARGRSAIEAMAVGCAVVLCDVEGLGPSVTRERVESLAAANFGMAVLTEDPRIDLVRARLDEYHARNAAAVQDWIREHLDLDAAVDRIENVYTDSLADWSGRSQQESNEGAEMASYLRLVQTSVIPQLVSDIQVAGERNLAPRIAAARSEIAELQERLTPALERAFADETRFSEAASRAELLEAELESLRASRAVRLRTWLSRHPTLAASYRSLVRMFTMNRHS